MAPRKPPSRRNSPRSAGLSDPAREQALRFLVDLESSKVPAGGRIEQIESGFEKGEDRRLFRSIVSENLRHRLRIDHVLGQLLEHRPLEQLPPWIRGALRVGATQVLLLRRIPPHAAVHTTVELAGQHGHRGTTGLVNAVLRRLVEQGEVLWAAVGAIGGAEAGLTGAGLTEHGPTVAGPTVAGPTEARLIEPGRTEAGPTEAAPIAPSLVRALSLRYSHPEWIIRRWVARWGVTRTVGVLAWNQEHPDYWIRLRPGESPPLRSTPGWIPQTARLASESRILESEGLLSGDWTIQDGSAILVGWIPPFVRGVVLDLCAAPGTKSGHLRERAEPGARVVALDLSPGRLRRMRRGWARRNPVSEDVHRDAHGHSHEDAHEAAHEDGTPPGVDAAPGSLLLLVAADGRRVPVREPWDGVLVDAPCSNLGVLRRRVDLKWRAREEEIARLASIQGDLLEEASRGVARGGWLVYSVCTLEAEETTDRRDAFLRDHPSWSPISLPEFLPERARGREGEMILLPGELETDGTYAFVLRRNE